MEIAEVQTVTNELNQTIKGKKINKIKVVNKNLIRPLKIPDFISLLEGKTVKEAKRHCKYLIIRLEENIRIVIHFKMTGSLYYSSQGEIPQKFLGLAITFQSGETLVYQDKIKWGSWRIFKTRSSLEEFFNKLGIDPLKKEINFSSFFEKLKSSPQNIYIFLMDQSNICGLGNIYVNEVLFQARVSPEKIASSISQQKARKLYKAILDIVQKAVQKRGTTVSDYFDLFGEKGEYQKYLKVYQRDNQPCLACKTSIKRGKIQGRSVFFCPKCQNS